MKAKLGWHALLQHAPPASDEVDTSYDLTKGVMTGGKSD